MSSNDSLEGNCLCGAVTVSAKVENKNIGACHCEMCRRWGGGPMLAIDCGNNISFNGEENIASFQSSDWAQRGFCQQCGTHLFYRLKDTNQHIVPVGIFNGSNQYNFDHQIFIDEKPDFYDFSNNTKNMTGEEVFAQFAPPENN